MWLQETRAAYNIRKLAESSSLPTATVSSTWVWACLTPALHSVPTSTSVNVKYFQKVPIIFLFISTTMRPQISQSESIAEVLKKAHQWNVQAAIANSSSSSCNQCSETWLPWQDFVTTQETRKIQTLSRCFHTPYTVRLRVVQCLVTLWFSSAG